MLSFLYFQNLPSRLIANDFPHRINQKCCENLKQRRDRFEVKEVLNMYAVSRISGRNKVGILCEGNDVLQNRDCKQIAIKGKRFRVKDSEVTNSISDTLGLWLELDVKDPNDVPLGCVQVIS